MVDGLNYFLSQLADFKDHFILIGGAACDLWMDNLGRQFQGCRRLRASCLRFEKTSESWKDDGPALSSATQAGRARRNWCSAQPFHEDHALVATCRGAGGVPRIARGCAPPPRQVASLPVSEQ